MSLLTDEEMCNATCLRAPIGNIDYTTPLKGEARDIAIRDAQHATTLKAVAEWWDKECERGKRAEDPEGTFFALTSLLHTLNGLRKGKMPGEEK